MDKLKQLTPQHKLIMGVAFLGVVAGLFYYLVIMNLDDQIGAQKGQYTQAQNELKQFKDFRGEVEIAELRESYAMVIKKIEENKKIIPDKEDLPQLMSGLETDALEAGLSVISKEQRNSEHEDYYYGIPIKFEVHGSYLQFMKFLKLISEPGKRLVNVKQLDIKLAKKKMKKKMDAQSPFMSSGKVATPESTLVATFVVEGFTYTGEMAGKRKKK